MSDSKFLNRRAALLMLAGSATLVAAPIALQIPAAMADDGEGGGGEGGGSGGNSGSGSSGSDDNDNETDDSDSDGDSGTGTTDSTTHQMPRTQLTQPTTIPAQ